MVQSSPRSLARDRLSPEGFIEPCQPVLSAVVPVGPDWIHELKHDGWRILARKDADRVHLWSRNGRNWTAGFPGIAAALAALPLQSFVLDGEAATHNQEGWPDFHSLHSHVGRDRAELVTFDVLMVNGEDIRPWPSGPQLGTWG
jgi:ATP-dependent DNA ligase